MTLAPKLLGPVVVLVLIAVAIVSVAFNMKHKVNLATDDIVATSQSQFYTGRGVANGLAYFRNVEFLPLELSQQDRQRYEAAATDERNRMIRRLDQIEQGSRMRPLAAVCRVFARFLAVMATSTSRWWPQPVAATIATPNASLPRGLRSQTRCVRNCAASRSIWMLP